MGVTRRNLFKGGAAGVGVLAIGNVGALWAGEVAGAATAPARSATGATGAAGPSPRGAGYGELVPDPAGVLDLPPGFSYTVVSEAGQSLPAGGALPDRFDGTAAFAAAGGGVYLVRNHEQGDEAELSTVDAAGAAWVYDPGAAGGTSTVLLDASGAKVDEYVSLAGTFNNCAGGATPWGTWLTCEETEVKAGDGLERDHGFVFEVDPADPERNRDPFPLTAMGRFPHEAVVVDPHTGTVYLTEDASKPFGLVYRFTPTNPRPGYGNLREGGALEAMVCTDRDGTVSTDLSGYTTVGDELTVSWVAVPDPLATTTSTRKQFAVVAPGGRGAEVTRSQKFEGAWWGRDRAYIVCSFSRVQDGGARDHDGQVWSYDPGTSTLRLEVFFVLNEDEAGDGPDGPDNITVSPWGGLMLAEDGEGVQHLLAVAPDGTTSPFARNRRDDSELTGVVFSPDRRTLYANIQAPGTTFAVTGPFARLG